MRWSAFWPVIVKVISMNMLATTVCSVLVIALCGCPVAGPKAAGPMDTVPRHAVFVHPSSGMTFPAAVGEFNRSTILRHGIVDPEVSVAYDLVSVALTVSAVIDINPAPSLDTTGLPAGMAALARENLTHQEYGASMREIMGSHPGAQLIQEGEYTLPQRANPFPGKMAVFEYEDVFLRQRQQLRSHLYIFCFAGDDWTIRYQFTYPKDLYAVPDIDSFLMNLPWTLKRASRQDSP